MQFFRQKPLTGRRGLCYNDNHLREGLFFVCTFVLHDTKKAALEGGNKLAGDRRNGGAVMRVKITLACTECKQRNYDTMKNKKNDPDRLEMNKYCRFCRKHTLHRETK